MCVVIIRAVMLYVLVIFAVRLMGKRQLGELQPSELVITILVSNIATLPIENTDMPLIVGVTPILILVSFEVLMSWLSLRSGKVRRLVSGSPKIVIRGGKIAPEVLRELRFSVDDLMTALRGQNIFSIEEVQFAIVETTGSISVMKKQTADTPDRSDMELPAQNEDPPQVVAADGRIISAALSSLGIGESELLEVISGAGLSLREVFIMTGDSSGNYYIADSRGSEPVIIRGGTNDES